MHAAALSTMLILLVGCASPLRPSCGLGPSQNLAAGAATPEGGSLADLLAVAAGRRMGTMRWQQAAPPASDLQVSPPPGTASFTIEVTSTAASGVYRPGRVLDGARTTACPSELTLDAVARVASGDGALDETWAVSLQGPPAGDSASFRLDMRAKPLAGWFNVVDPMAASWDRTALIFDATLDRNGGGSGSVSYSANRVRGDVHEGYATTLGAWRVPPAQTDGGQEAGAP